MISFTTVMKALTDANRVKILKLLQIRSLCVCELQGVLGLPQPTVSKNLKILEEAGLVVSSRDGLWVNYAPADGSRSPYAATLLGNLRHWLEDEPDLRRAKAQLPFVNREKLCRRQGANQSSIDRQAAVIPVEAGIGCKQTGLP